MGVCSLEKRRVQASRPPSSPPVGSYSVLVIVDLFPLHLYLILYIFLFHLPCLRRAMGRCCGRCSPSTTIRPVRMPRFTSTIEKVAKIYIRALRSIEVDEEITFRCSRGRLRSRRCWYSSFLPPPSLLPILLLGHYTEIRGVYNT